MKTTRRNSVVILLCLALLLTNCSKDSAHDLTGPQSQTISQNADMDFDKKKNNPPSADFPIVKSKIFRFNNGLGVYNGGSIKFGSSNKSQFSLDLGALTPPDDIPWGENVEITMVIDYDSTTQELLFSFGPHGSQFDPPAQIKMDFARLGDEVPDLYYVEDDSTYTPMEPDEVSQNKKWLKIWVNHFSRYALMHG